MSTNKESKMGTIAAVVVAILVLCIATLSCAGHAATAQPASGGATGEDNKPERDDQSPSPKDVLASSGGRWRKPKNKYEGQKVDWEFDNVQISFFHAGSDINIFGRCDAASAALKGRVRVRGVVTDVSEYTNRLTISDAVIEPVSVQPERTPDAR